MNNRDAIMKRGREVYETLGFRRGVTWSGRKFAETPGMPAYILVENRFTSGHDDSATFVELIDEHENILRAWKFEGPEPRRFADPDLYDDDCLVYYLKETLGIEAVQHVWGRKAGEA